MAVNYVLHYTYYSLVYSEMDNARKEKQFDKYHGNLKYIFLGDSHSQNAIDPSIIGNSFNFSSANESYLQTYYKLKGIIFDFDRKPEYVVIPIDPSSFSSYRTSRFVKVSTLLTFNNYLEIAIKLKDPTYLQTWLKYEFFIYAGNYTMVNRYILAIKNRNYSTMKLGFKGRNGNLTKTDNIEEICAKYATTYLGNQNYFDPILQEYFVRILQFCHDENIKVYLMKMPLSKEYIKACKAIFPVDDYYKQIAEIAAQNKVVKYTFDYQDFFIDEPQYFRNPDHMNLHGAEIFSTQLANDLSEIETK